LSEVEDRALGELLLTRGLRGTASNLFRGVHLSAQKHLFVGRQSGQFEARLFKHLQAEWRKSYWADLSAGILLQTHQCVYMTLAVDRRIAGERWSFGHAALDAFYETAPVA